MTGVKVVGNDKDSGNAIGEEDLQSPVTVHCKIAYVLKCIILLATIITMLVQPIKSDLLRTCKNTIGDDIQCNQRLLPTLLIAGITVIQVLVMIPGLSAVHLYIARVLQIAGLFGLKAAVQAIEATFDEGSQETAAYVGYCLFVGMMAAAQTAEVPNQSRRTANVYKLLILILLVVGMVIDAAFNKSQMAYGMNARTIAVCAITCLIGYGLLAAITYCKDANGNIEHFDTYALGVIFYVYATIPGTLAYDADWQIGSAVGGAITYIAVFALTKLAICYKTTAAIPTDV